jgi:hypothetical protein
MLERGSRDGLEVMCCCGHTVPGSRGKARFYHEVPAARCYELTAGIDWKEHNGPKLQSVRDHQATEGDTKNLRVPPSLLKDLAKGITHSSDNPFTRSQCALGGSRKTAKKTAARQKSSAGAPSKAVRRSGGQLPDQKFSSLSEATLWLVEQTGKTTKQGESCRRCGHGAGPSALRGRGNSIPPCTLWHTEHN